MVGGDVEWFDSVEWSRVSMDGVDSRLETVGAIHEPEIVEAEFQLPACR
jgi:hypothetical protein